MDPCQYAHKQLMRLRTLPASSNIETLQPSLANGFTLQGGTESPTTCSTP